MDADNDRCRLAGRIGGCLGRRSTASVSRSHLAGLGLQLTMASPAVAAGFTVFIAPRTGDPGRHIGPNCSLAGAFHYSKLI